jgi:hypothetical protein
MKFKNFLLLFFLISLILPNYLKSDECKNFEDKVLNITTPEGKIVSAGEKPKYDLGLFFQQNFDYKKNKIIIKRDLNNYPVLKFSLFERDLKPNTSIITIDNLDLSKKTDIEIFNLLKKIKLNISTTTDTYLLEAGEYDLYPFDLEFFTISAIDEIQTKDGEFRLDYNFQVAHERPDWIEAGREIGNFTYCPLEKIHESTKIYSPISDYEYLVQIGYDQDKSFALYEQNYFKDLDKTYSLATRSGEARIKIDFDLKKFPFDEQELIIELFPPYGINYNDDKNYPKPFVTTFTPRSNVYLDIEKYKNKNFLKEWSVEKVEVDNIINKTKSTSLFDRDKIIDAIDDRINIKIKVKRNINYFIFKIIIPVFLILSIVWSVMWIPPNQVESRLTTSIVGLLSLIAYNFVFNDDLPKLSYLTSLDRYVLLSYLFCAIPTFLTVYFSRLTKKDYQIALAVNKKSRIVGIVIYIISTAVIFS